MDVSMQVKKAALRTALGYIEKDPEENLMKLMDWVDKLAGDGPESFPSQRAAFRNVLNDPQCGMHRLIMNVLRDVDTEIMSYAIWCFIRGYNADALGRKLPLETAVRNFRYSFGVLLDGMRAEPPRS